MDKNIPLWLLSTVLLITVSVVDAQQHARVPKIGWVGFRSASDRSPGREAFKEEFRVLGYLEGKNIVIERRSAEGKLDRLPGVVDELVRLKVDVIVAPSTPSALAAKNATKTIPIVFYDVSDPIAPGLVDSLARPGGNITGITDIGAVLVGKRLELLKETMPNLSRVALLWNPQDGGSVQQWKESQLAARELGLQLYSMEVSRADKYESAFKEAIKARSSALAIAGSPLVLSNQKRIADLAVKSQLPAIASRPDFVADGGLMSYGGDRSEPYKRAASMVDKILKGAKPADLPVEQPTKFEFLINLKTAKALGLTIPPVVLMRAEKVIK